MIEKNITIPLGFKPRLQPAHWIKLYVRLIQTTNSFKSAILLARLSEIVFVCVKAGFLFCFFFCSLGGVFLFMVMTFNCVSLIMATIVMNIKKRGDEKQCPDVPTWMLWITHKILSK